MPEPTGGGAGSLNTAEALSFLFPLGLVGLLVVLGLVGLLVEAEVGLFVGEKQTFGIFD